MNQNKITIKQICIWATIIRFITLFFIFIFSDNLSTGFLSSEITNDDVRYLAGGEIYANTASNIIDKKAFTNAFDSLGDWAGHENLEIWYWFVCIGMYIFHSEIPLRIINILFSIFTIKCIYDISNKLYGKKIALLSSALYSFLPYPVFFSCFLFKDQLYTLIVLMLIKSSIFNGNNIRLRNIIFLISGIILSLLIRSGVVIAIIAILLYIIKKEGHYKLSNPRLWIPIIIIISVFIIFISISLDKIIVKITAYIIEFETVEGRVIDFLYIKNPLQLYRYPFSLLFMIISPLNMGTQINSWCDLVGILNIISLPIAFGNFFYLINWKFKKNYFYWSIQILFLITIITSLGILRHSYYLVPFSVIFFADFISHCKAKKGFTILSFISIFIYLLFIWIYWI